MLWSGCPSDAGSVSGVGLVWSGIEMVAELGEVLRGECLVLD